MWSDSRIPAGIAQDFGTILKFLLEINGNFLSTRGSLLPVMISTWFSHINFCGFVHSWQVEIVFVFLNLASSGGVLLSTRATWINESCLEPWSNSKLDEDVNELLLGLDMQYLLVR